MKKLFTFLAIIVIAATTTNAQNITSTLGTGGDFIINSTTGGILIPRMTESDRGGILAPDAGLMVYQTDDTASSTAGFYYHNGTKWIKLAASGSTSIDDLSDGLTYANDVFMGEGAGSKTSETYRNTGIGVDALKVLETNSANKYGYSNVALGYNAGSSITSGSANTLIGAGAGSTNLTTGQANIIIGTPTNSTSGSIRTYEVASATDSYQMNIGNTIFASGMSSDDVKVGIGNGNNAPKSTLDIKGSVTYAIQSTGGADGNPLTNKQYTINIKSHTGLSVVLPSAVGIEGRVYIIKNSIPGTQGTTATEQIVIPSIGSNEKIDGASQITLTQYQCIQVQSIGSGWIIIGKF